MKVFGSRGMRGKPSTVSHRLRASRSISAVTVVEELQFLVFDGQHGRALPTVSDCPMETKLVKETTLQVVIPAGSGVSPRRRNLDPRPRVHLA